jgi:hypothetical protein
MNFAHGKYFCTLTFAGQVFCGKICLCFGETGEREGELGMDAGSLLQELKTTISAENNYIERKTIPNRKENNTECKIILKYK